MHARFGASRGRFLAMIVLLTMVTAPRLVAGGQAPAKSAAEIEGIWNYSSLTPIERPPEFAGKAFLTPQEAAAFTKQVLERTNMDRRDGSVDADLARAYNDAWYDRGTRVATVYGRTRTSLVIDPPDGRLPALTAEGQRRAADRAQARRDHPADGPEDRSLAERCLSFNAGPPMLPGPYNNFVQILQFRDHVVIANEMIHDARVVPLDGRRHRSASIRSWQGDSVGRWEGATLVVDTVHFTDKTAFRGASDRLHLVERFTRADAHTLLYEFTVDDPASFTKPWTVSLPMTKSSDQIYEYACHEGNYALPDILRGARAQEKTGPRH
ncbi:MAG: hypothetical protein HY048_05755 [Acidobacteria bacterium]|nr:hypothetical protein [Acidobacteriota bacterium]